MSLLYTLNQINRTFKDGRKDTANGKWFARAIHLQTVGIDYLAEECAYSTTVTKADCKAVIEALIRVIQTALGNSLAVKIDGLGTFKLGLKCKGALEAEDFSVSNNVVGVHCNFMPSFTRDVATGRKLCPMTDGVRVREAPKNAVGVVTD